MNDINQISERRPKLHLPQCTVLTITAHRVTFDPNRKVAPYTIMMRDTDGNVFDVVLSTEAACSLNARLSHCLDAAIRIGTAYDAGVVDVAVVS